MDKYDLMSQNKDGETYLSKYLEYLKEKLKYDEDIKAGKKLRKLAPTLPDITQFDITPKDAFFGLKEIELLGTNWTPLFGEYEGLRCLKSNCDTQILENYEHQLETHDSLILMVMPIKLEQKQSKSGNEYYKLHFLDEFMMKYIYVQLNKFVEYRSNIVLKEPAMLLVSTKGSMSSLKGIKPCSIIPPQEIESITFNSNWEEERLISKMLLEDIGGNTKVIFNNKSPKFKINLTYRLLKRLNSEGYKFKLNNDIIDDSFNISGCENIDEYNEFLEEIKLNNR